VKLYILNFIRQSYKNFGLLCSLIFHGTNIRFINSSDNLYFIKKK
jgi:hypothetical protein